MAATAVALWLDELDYGGLPESLDALVPAYLDQIPLDPLAEPGTPIGYVPDADPPALYSVGENGVHEGGEFRVNARGERLWGSADWPLLLRPPKATHSQPSEKQDDE